MTEIRKQRVAVLIPVLIFSASMIGILVFWQYAYQRAAFEHISAFCEMMTEEDPEAEIQVLSALKEYQTRTENEGIGNERTGNLFLAQYGYQSSDFGGSVPWKVWIASAALFFVMICGFLSAVWYLDQRNKKRIAELTDYLEQVNVGAAGTLIQTKEDDFSRLQDEICKTVTSLYQTRESAVQAKENFAENLANIAHQLKTPITAAFLSLQLMKKTAPGEQWEKMERQLKRLNQLEESLLTLSKIDTGTLHLEYSQVDLYTVLNLAAENLSDLLVKEEISVEIPDHGCMEIYGDMEWTMEAFMNLMKNCMEHSKRGGTIHSDYSVNPLYTEILIWDDGTGFRAEEIPHLFDRFYRGKDETGKGTGIGLSISRSIIEMQNGSITAKNLQSGGACFEIRMYAHKTASAAQKADVQRAETPHFNETAHSH